MFQIEDYRRLCGNHMRFPAVAPTKGEKYKSEANTVLIRFVSDYSNEAPLPIGFEAHWTEKGKCNIVPGCLIYITI